MLIRSTKAFNLEATKILIYGKSGAGKTTLASTIDEPSIVISAESGLLSLHEFNLDYIDITQDGDGNTLTSQLKFQRLQEVGQYLLSQEAKAKYKWVFIDSLTEIGQIVHEAIKASDTKYQDAKNNLQLWGVYGEKMRAVIKFFRDLPGYNVVFTALAKSEKDELSRRFMGVDLQGKISEQLPGYFDEVFYYDVISSEDGEKIRRLITQPSDLFIAKDRSGKLEEFEKPNLSDIAKKIRGVKNV